MKLIHYLKQPFPKAESKWKIIFLISLFIALFLIVFQPFGINLFDSKYKILILSGYGVVSFISLIINLILVERIFPIFFAEKNWTLWKEFLWLIWVIFFIGLGNVIYTLLIFENLNFNFHNIAAFQIITFVVSLFPVTILIISKQKYLLRRHLNSASELNKSLESDTKHISGKQLIRFFADNEKDFIEFDINDFFYIESSGNYIEIYFQKEEKLIRKTFRSTLKRALDFFNETHNVIQCHRAFIVNTNKVINAKGNSQGLLLHLENCDFEVPVSRNYVDTVRSKIR